MPEGPDELDRNERLRTEQGRVELHVQSSDCVARTGEVGASGNHQRRAQNKLLRGEIDR